MHEKLTEFIKELRREEQRRIYSEMLSKYPQLMKDIDEEEFINNASSKSGTI